MQKVPGMNQSDDEIFGRNIDQLDRETPRYNLSEEEDGDGGGGGGASGGKTGAKGMCVDTVFV